MGAVYKACDTRLDRIVAIKVSNQQFSDRFEREARAVAALNHPHICQLYDVGPNYLVMEFVEGTPLKGPMPLDKAITCATQVLDALQAAHRKGITHRDLKPGNILLARQGIKLLDFGLAKSRTPAQAVTDSTLTQPLTSQGTILGTVPYMSPEQIQGQDADPRSDIFSFGIVLYELLTGRRPFEGKTQMHIMAAILEHDLPPASDLPPAIERVMRHCLAKDPDARWQSAQDVALALRTPEALPAAATAQPAGRPIAWMAAAGVLAVVAAVSGYLAIQRPGPNNEVRRYEVSPPSDVALVSIRSSRASLAISPDGRNVVYSGVRKGQRSLWLHSLVTNQAREIQDSAGGVGAFWSPDSKFVGFGADGQLTRVSIEGGPPTAVTALGNSFFGAAWSPDGTILFHGPGGGIHAVSASGGRPRPVTKLDSQAGELAHAFPQLLPGKASPVPAAPTPGGSGWYYARGRQFG